MNDKLFQNSLTNMGFRIFFLSAGIFAVISVAMWMAIYMFGFDLSLSSLSISQWHAHEMIYGYSFAVITGFLLTAVKNWTGIQTLHGKPLMALFCVWLIPRIIFLTGIEALPLAAVMDILFAFGVLYGISQPIIKSKSWKQLIIVAKIVTLALCNLAFYLGSAGYIDNGVTIGIYGGLYLVIGLILTLGRRVLPFFIEKGVDENVQLSNYKWLDLSALFAFLAFYLIEVFLDYPKIAAIFALALSFIYAARLVLWYTPGIWNKSLLWSLYIGFWFIPFGFALLAAAKLIGLNQHLAIHAFAFGGIGVITLGMMSRVSLGHTGRGIANPSGALNYAFSGLIAGATIRVVFPLVANQYYIFWVGLSQIIWLMAFAIFVFVYAPILSKPRVDDGLG